MPGFGPIVQFLWRGTLGLSLALTVACAGPGSVRNGGPGSAPAPLGSGRTGPVGSGARRVSLAPRRGRHRPLGIDRKDLDRILDAGPGALLVHVPLAPVFAPGHRFLGFRIVSLWGNDRRALRYGPRPGDLLRSINGQRVETPDQLVAVFKLARNATTIAVTVSRAGRRLRFQWPVYEVEQTRLGADDSSSP